MILESKVNKAMSPCVDCGEMLAAKHRGCLPNRCTGCRKEYNRERQRAWREANPERAIALQRRSSEKRVWNAESNHSRWASRLKSAYGLTVADYEAILVRQNGTCAICEGPPNGPGSQYGRLHVDHCHETGKVRGLLCGKCNTAIGLLDDDPERAKRVAEYL